MNTDQAENTPCETCGEPSLGVRCDNCWEFEHRLDGFLERGGTPAETVVKACLARHAQTVVK